jgi:hypothetical protein
MEAEYVALSYCSREAVWYFQFLPELSFPLAAPLGVLCDNHAAISLSHDCVVSDKSKHIRIAYHNTRDLIETKIITVTHMASTEMPADVFTKPLPFESFDRHRTTAGLSTS